MKKVLLFVTTALIMGLFVIGNRQTSVLLANESLSKTLRTNTLNQLKTFSDNYDQLTSYYEVYHNWQKNKIKAGNDHHVLSPNQLIGGTSLSSAESHGYGSNVIYLEPLDQVEFQVQVEDAGLYQIYLDYFVLPKTRLMPRMGVQVNGQAQYTEMYDLELYVDWKLEEETLYDRYGDELTPKSQINSEWNMDQGLYDPNYFMIEPLQFQLDAGMNTISLTMNEGYLLLGDVLVETKSSAIPNYENYIEQYKNPNKVNDLIRIEAEDLVLKSRQSITAKYMRDPSVKPYDYKNRVLNVLDGNSFGTAGDRVTYQFEIEEAGFYQLALKYYQNLNNGLPSHRRILIDGKVPFEEFESYAFSYQTKWKNEVLQDTNGVPFQIYLTEGKHTLTLAVDNALVAPIYHDLMAILAEINAIGTDISKITGGLNDRDRNWKITTYLPDLEERLSIVYQALKQSIKDVSAYTGDDDLPLVSELKIASELLAQFINDPEELPGYMNKFNEGESSAYGRINTIIPQLIYSPLHLDAVYVYNQTELPKANANFFIKIAEGVKSFFYSFFDPKYNENVEVDDETIEIWVNKSRLYVEVMQRMIDEEFTPKTGVKVQLSLMPDENKIILSNAAGSTPDGVIGISFTKPFELAIRGVTEDLRHYDGFYDLVEEFNPSTFVPYIYDDGVYAMPETQDVKFLFYRKDVFNQLGVTPPQTWEDVVTLVPVLQKYDMNFYSTIGNESSFKGFDVTSPFIYQFGGQLYDPETMGVVINKGEAYQAFELMTDLFTVYNLPVTTANFYQQFRNGKIPVGIGDANMYIQLKYAAPELAGQWGILPIPGVENEEGIIERWDPTYGSSSVIFQDSEKKQQTWELIKWWSGKDAQADFSYEIQSILGDKFLYMTANIEGFKESAWPSDSKSTVLKQWEWIQATGKVPGDYMLEREISNAWNKVIFDGINPRVAIDQSINTINHELIRKLTEFGYMDDKGTIIRPYKIPTIDNVESWLRKNEND